MKSQRIIIAITIVLCTTATAFAQHSSQSTKSLPDSVQAIYTIADKIGLLTTLQRDEQRLRDTSHVLYPLLSVRSIDSIFLAIDFQTLALKSARRAFLKHFTVAEFDTLSKFFKQGFFPERSVTLKKYDMSQATLMDEMANEYQKVIDYAASVVTYNFYKRRTQEYAFAYQTKDKDVQQSITTFFTWHGEIGIVDTVSSLVRRRISRGISDASPNLYEEVTKTISLPSLFGASFSAGMLKHFSKAEVKELAELQGDKTKMEKSKAFKNFQKKIQGNFVNDFNDAVNQMVAYLYDTCLTAQASKRINVMRQTLD